MDQATRTRRNLDGHAEAKAAIWMWGEEYAAQGGGVMDFWDGLEPSRKMLMRKMVDEITEARRAPKPRT